MPLKSAASARTRGWWNDQINGRIVAVYNGTEIFDYDGNDMAIAQSLATVGIVSASGNIVATTGAITATAGDINATAGNFRAGAVSAFATTEPTSAIVFKAGTAFAGAITTSGGLMSNGTVVRKIIADGTVSNVET